MRTREQLLETRNRLRELVRQLDLWLGEDAPPVRAQETSGEAHVPECPLCHGLMVKRQGKRGAFWGCSGFPVCRGSRDLGSYGARITLPPAMLACPDEMDPYDLDPDQDPVWDYFRGLTPGE